jgi:hypothetical protein
MFTEKTFKQA